MAKINEWMQDNPSLFIPLVQTWNADELPSLMVPKLRDVLKIESQGELPGLYLYHTRSDSVIKYPEILHDMQKFSPELVMTWGQIRVYEKDNIMLRQRLADFEANPDNEQYKLTDEQVEEINKMMEERRTDLEEL